MRVPFIPTVRLTAEVFGREKASIVFGWVAAAHQVGAAFAAYTAGALRTWLQKNGVAASA